MFCCFSVITGLGFDLRGDSFFPNSDSETDLAGNDAVSQIWGGGGERILHAKVL